MRIWLTIIVFLVLAGKLAGQNRVSVDTGGFVYPSFICAADNVLRGKKEALEIFFSKLYELRRPEGGKTAKVRVVHIGDSHLQAGYLNGTVMRRFHADFGNAGRGLIVPLKLSETNEPIDYDIVSDIGWNAEKCLSRRPRYPVGIGGISIVPRDTVFRLEVQIPSAEAGRYRFNQVDVYHLPGAAILKPLESTVVEESSPWPFVSRYRMTELHRTLTFEGHARQKDSCVYYGFSLENGKRGVLYHTIGINGAQFMHYRNIDRFAEQVHSLTPDLVIFSLGTNEAFRGYFSEAFIRQEMDAVVLAIQQTNPGAVVLLTTPAECQWKVKRGNLRVYEPNPYIEPIAETIEQYAGEHGFVYWDLFGMSGGAGSSENWISGDYLTRDRIHFGVSGYRLQGNLLYTALMKEYNNYVERRLRREEAERGWKKLLVPMWGNVSIGIQSFK